MKADFQYELSPLHQKASAKVIEGKGHRKHGRRWGIYPSPSDNHQAHDTYVSTKTWIWDLNSPRFALPFVMQLIPSNPIGGVQCLLYKTQPSVWSMLQRESRTLTLAHNAVWLSGSPELYVREHYEDYGQRYVEQGF